MQTVILAGGLGTRLRPLTYQIPKSMVSIYGKPFLEYQLELLKRNNLKNVLLCIGHLGKAIKNYFKNGKRWGINIFYSFEKRPLGTAGALKNAENLLETEFLTIYGDSYLPFDFQKAIEFFKKFNKLSLMTVYKNYDKYEKSNVALEGNLVKEYNKNRKATKEMKYIDYGVSIFKKEALKFVPTNQTYDLSRLHKLLIKKRELLAYQVKKRFYQIGSPDGLEEFKKYIKKI